MRVVDIAFNYLLDTAPPGKDPDSHSPWLKADHQLLWTKELCEGQLFELVVSEDPKVRRNNYLMFEQTPEQWFTFGNDANTNSYTRWGSLGLWSSFANRVPYGDVNRSLGDVVVNCPAQYRVNPFPVQNLGAQVLWSEHVVDDRRDGFLGLPVGVGAGRSVSDSHDSVVSVDAD
jgi:hypothetical protein